MIFEYFEHRFDTSGMQHESFVHTFNWLGRRFESKCQVDIFKYDGKTLVLLTDLGQGTSVTNASEQIATEVMRLKKLHPIETMWAEVYAEDLQNGVPKEWAKKHPFDQINYKYDSVTHQYYSPDWQPIHPKALPEPKKELKG